MRLDLIEVTFKLGPAKVSFMDVSLDRVTCFPRPVVLGHRVAAMFILKCATTELLFCVELIG